MANLGRHYVYNDCDRLRGLLGKKGLKNEDVKEFDGALIRFWLQTLVDLLSPFLPSLRRFSSAWAPSWSLLTLASR